MKAIYLILLLLFTGNVIAEIYIYDNEYAGVRAGYSSKEDVIVLHGEPNRQSQYTNDMKFHYDEFHVTFQNDTGKVNKILMFDPEYIDGNGIKIGTPKVVLEEVLREKAKRDYMVDKDKGVIYWIKEELVSKIVLNYELILSSDVILNGKEGANLLALPNGDSVLVKSLAIKDVIPSKKFFSIERFGEAINPNGVPVEAHIVENNKNKDKLKKILILNFYPSHRFSDKDRLMSEANLILPYVKKMAENVNIKLISIRPTIPISQYAEGFGERIFYFEKRLFFYKTTDGNWVLDVVNP